MDHRRSVDESTQEDARLCALAPFAPRPEGSKGLSELILQVLEKRKSLKKSAVAHKKKMYAMLYQNNSKKPTSETVDAMDIDNDTDEDHDDGDDNELEDEDNKNNNKSESSTWVKALVMTLLGHEKPVNAVVSLVDAMKVRFFFSFLFVRL